MTARLKLLVKFKQAGRCAEVNSGQLSEGMSPMSMCAKHLKVEEQWGTGLDELLQATLPKT